MYISVIYLQKQLRGGERGIFLNWKWPVLIYRTVNFRNVNEHSYFLCEVGIIIFIYCKLGKQFSQNVAITMY